MNINILDWKFWLVLIILIILIRWLFVRGDSNQHQFVGLKPLHPNTQNNIPIINAPDIPTDPDKVIVVNSWAPQIVNSVSPAVTVTPSVVLSPEMSPLPPEV